MYGSYNGNLMQQRFQWTRSYHRTNFTASAHAMRNWRENPCIFDVLQNTIGWEYDGRKVAMLWEKYGYLYPRSSQQGGFYCIFLCYEKLIRNTMHFPCNEVYHRMGIGWEKSTHTIGKVWAPISQFLPISALSCAMEYWWETHAFPIRWHSLIFSWVLDYLCKCWQTFSPK